MVEVQTCKNIKPALAGVDLDFCLRIEVSLQGMANMAPITLCKSTVPTQLCMIKDLNESKNILVREKLNFFFWTVRRSLGMLMGNGNGNGRGKGKYVQAEKSNSRNWYLVAVIWLQLVLVCLWFIQSNRKLDDKKTVNIEDARNVLQEREKSLNFLPAAIVPAIPTYREPECEPLSQCQKDCDWEPTFGKVDYHQHQPGSKHVLVTVRWKRIYIRSNSIFHFVNV